MLEMPRPCLRRHPEHPDMRCVDIAGHGGAHMAHDALGEDVLWHDDDDGLAGLAAREARMTEREAQALRDEFAGLAKEIRAAYQQGYADGVDDERAAVVAWLREHWSEVLEQTPQQTARLIERGEHRREEKL